MNLEIGIDIYALSIKQITKESLFYSTGVVSTQCSMMT